MGSTSLELLRSKFSPNLQTLQKINKNHLTVYSHRPCRTARPMEKNEGPRNIKGILPVLLMNNNTKGELGDTLADAVCTHGSLPMISNAIVEGSKFPNAKTCADLKRDSENQQLWTLTKGPKAQKPSPCRREEGFGTLKGDRQPSLTVASLRNHPCRMARGLHRSFDFSPQSNISERHPSSKILASCFCQTIFV
ncbi:unnamed protein product [Prunus armeniaca]